jgi:ribonuclease-3
MKSIEDLEKEIGVAFSDRKLIETAFTHRSYLNEHKSLNIEHNERLEFLGDAVIELCVTEYLFKQFNRPEGEMTNLRSALVKGESLSAESKRLGINELLKTSRGESKNTGKARDLLLANAFASPSCNFDNSSCIISGWPKILFIIKTNE